MKRRAALVAAGVAGTLVCGWLVFDRAREQRPDSSARSTGTAHAPPEERAVEERSELASPELAPREAVRGRHASVPARPQVLVVDGRNGAPLPGAVVRWLDVTDPAVLFALAREKASTKELAETIGGRAVADERGLAELPLTNPFHVLGRHGRLWNEAVAVHLGKDPLRLELFPDLVVEVVDDGGAPQAGVPLEAWMGDRHGLSPRSVQETGPDGRVAFSHRVIRRDPAVVLDVEVVFAFPLVDSVAVALRSDAIPEEPQRMVLPPTGRVVVELRALGGQLQRGPASVLLFAEGERVDERFRERQLHSGTFAFEHVGLGLDLVCRALVDPTEDWPSVNRLETRARGPRTAGEETRIVLGPGIHDPVLVGRVVDADGRPLASTRGHVTLLVSDEERLLFPPELSFPPGFELDTNSRGGFRIPLSKGPVPFGERTLVFTFPGAIAAEDKAQLDLSRQLPVGVTDLGDVVLGAAPLLAAGRVVDDEGRPIPGAAVWLARPHGFLSNGQRVWGHVDEPSPATTDALGAFEIRGWIEGEIIGIAAGFRGHQQAGAEPLTRGARDLVLRLARLGTVAGAVLLDPDLPAECVTVTLYRSREGAHPLEKQTRFPAAGETHATFRWEELEPGPRILEIEIASDPRPLLSIPLEVLPGEPPGPGLSAVDLRGLLRIVQITVLGESGAPLEEAWVQVLDPAREARPGRRFDGGTPVRGESAELVLARAVDVAVTAPWCGVERLERVLEDRTVRLNAGHRVQLVLPRTVVPPEAPLVLYAQLQPLATSARVKQVAERFAFDAGGKAVGWVHEPGSYGLTWIVERRRTDGSLEQNSSLREPSVILTVDERTEEQRFELQFDPGPLAERIQEL